MTHIRDFLRLYPLSALALVLLALYAGFMLVAQNSMPLPQTFFFHLLALIPYGLVFFEVYTAYRMEFYRAGLFLLTLFGLWLTLTLVFLGHHPAGPPNMQSPAFISLFGTLVGFGLLLYFFNEDEEPEIEPELDTDTFANWIDAYQPVLPENIREAYIDGARELIALYREERIDPTYDALLRARREREPPLPLGEVQLRLFEGYKKLANHLSRPLGEPPPLAIPTPPPRKIATLLNEDLGEIVPWSYERPDELFDSIFDYTPFARSPLSGVYDELKTLYPITRERFEGAWVVAPPGRGKTQLFQYLIAHDIPHILAGNASAVVMDSQGDLLKNIRLLKDIQDRLIVIEPDPVMPPALNPFIFAQKRINAAGELERPALTNNTLELLTYAFSTLGEGATLTPKQSVLYTYCIELCLAVPGATLNTFVSILNEGVGKYAREIQTLDDPAQQFFAYQFDDRDFRSTKQELAWRLAGLLKNPTFAGMFNAPDNKLDLFDALNRGTLILINTDKHGLGEERSRLFGRFMVAMVRSAIFERSTLSEHQRLPTYFYIDEAHEYLDNDKHIANLLDQARKMKLGLMLANQRTAQITDPNVRDALMTTAIKLIATDNDSDAHTFSRPLGVAPEAIIRTAKSEPGSFYLHARGVVDPAVSVSIPLGYLEELPRLSKDEALQALDYQRKTYRYRPTKRTAPPPTPEPDDDTPTPTL